VSTATRQAESRQASVSSRPYLVLLAVAAGSTMSGLDSGISNTVLPVIATALGADVADAQWVVSIYVLVLSCLLLAFGRLGDLRGYRRTYLAGFGLFVVSSATCAFATSMAMLVAARGIQAVGAAMLAANSPPILTNAFPEEQRGKALGLQATAVYLGLAVGPPLGGWLTAAFGWSAVFLINVPIGLAALLLGMRVIPRDRTRSQLSESFDVQGAALFSAGLVLLIFGLNQVHAWGWTSPLLLACVLAAGAALTMFVVVEGHKTSPLLDLGVFSSRPFSASVVSAILNYMSIFAMTFMLPFYLIQARGLSVAVAGLVLTAQPLVMALTAPFSGMLSDRIGARVPATAGMVIIALGLGLLSRLGLETPLLAIVATLLLIGFGVGLFTSPNTSAALGSVPRPRRGIASGVLATARNLGMVLGIGVGGAIFTSMLAPGPAAIAEAASAGLLSAAIIAALGAVTSALAR
jgi:EmrB/QacA subfamily drug resistance transporter